MLRPLKSIALGCLCIVGKILAAYGRIWVAVPEVHDPVPPGAEPGPLHPERICQEVPLSRIERALERQIRDLA